MLESLSLRIVSGDEEEEYNFNIPTLKRLILQTQRGRYNSFNKVVLNVSCLEYLFFWLGVGSAANMMYYTTISSYATISVDEKGRKILIIHLTLRGFLKETAQKEKI